MKWSMWSTIEGMKQTLCYLKKALGLISHMLVPHFWCLDATSTIQRSRGYEVYNIQNVKFMLCEPICVLCVTYSWYDLPIMKWASQETCPSKKACSSGGPILVHALLLCIISYTSDFWDDVALRHLKCGPNIWDLNLRAFFSKHGFFFIRSFVLKIIYFIPS